MIKLSRTAWNNVIIFAMLIMIFLFNGLHHKLNPSQAATTGSLLEQHQVVLVFKLADCKFERIGAGWRANSACNKELEPEALSLAWQTTTLNIESADEVNSRSSKPLWRGDAYIWLAGTANPMLFTFYQGETNWFIHSQAKNLWYRAIAEDIATLQPLILSE
jgi:phosphotransferase system  glucose/maltose/N-acetylglucosamine-specific IIC component